MDVDQEYKSAARRSVVLLTVLGALSQLLGFGYRVALSRMVGAEVMGLYQLVMPAFSVLLSLTAVGLTAAVSNLTSQYLAWENSRGAAQIVSSCLRWLMLLILPVGAAVIVFSDPISVYLLGDARTQLGLMLLVPCAALTGVENIHKHFFYGAGLVGPRSPPCSPSGPPPSSASTCWPTPMSRAACSAAWRPCAAWWGSLSPAW